MSAVLYADLCRFMQVMDFTIKEFIFLKSIKLLAIDSI